RSPRHAALFSVSKRCLGRSVATVWLRSCRSTAALDATRWSHRPCRLTGVVQGIVGRAMGHRSPTRRRSTSRQASGALRVRVLRLHHRRTQPSLGTGVVAHFGPTDVQDDSSLADRVGLGAAQVAGWTNDFTSGRKVVDYFLLQLGEKLADPRVVAPVN